MTELVLTPIHPSDGLCARGTGVSVRPLPDLALAQVIARPGRRQAVNDAFAVIGVTLPDRPHLAEGVTMAAIGLAPGAWLAVAPTGGPLWAFDLAEWLGGLAAVADQSDAYVAVSVEGPGAGAMLRAAVGVDLHEAAFPIGAAAVTAAAHMGLILWRRGADTYELLALRSYAESFWSWLLEIGARVGLEVV